MFQISNDMPENVLDIKLIDLLCKHVYFLSDKSRSVLDESSKLDYKWCLWGRHCNGVSMQHHLSIIKKMEEQGFKPAIRVIKCDYGFSSDFKFWSDNLHSTIMYIRKYGYGVKLRDIKFYLVDLETNTIYSYKDSLILDKEKVNGAYNCGVKRFLRSNSEKLLNIDYRIHDFLFENYWLLR